MVKDTLSTSRERGHCWKHPQNTSGIPLAQHRERNDFFVIQRVVAVGCQPGIIFSGSSSSFDLPPWLGWAVCQAARPRLTFR